MRVRNGLDVGPGVAGDDVVLRGPGALEAGPHEVLLGRPAAVDGGEADAGPVGDVLHAQLVVARRRGAPRGPASRMSRCAPRRCAVLVRARAWHRRSVPCHGSLSTGTQIPGTILIGNVDFRLRCCHGGSTPPLGRPVVPRCNDAPPRPTKRAPVPPTARAPAGGRNAHGDHDGTRTPRNGSAPTRPRRARRQRTLVLAAMCLALVLVIAGVSMLAVGLPSRRRRPRPQPDQPHLGRRRLRPHPGLAPAGRRRARRPLRAAGRAARRHRAVRRRLAAVGVRRLGRPAHRLPGAHRHRRGADHAGHPVHDHQRVPARGAGPGRGHLGRVRRRRRHARACSAAGWLLGLFSWRSIFVLTAAVSRRHLRRRARGRAEPAGPTSTSASTRSAPCCRPSASAPSCSASSRARSAGGPSRSRWARSSPASCWRVAFVRWELRTEHPLLDPRLFRHRGFATGSASMLVLFLVLFGLFLVVLQYLQLLLGYSALERGRRPAADDVRDAPDLDGRPRRCRCATGSGSSAAPAWPDRALGVVAFAMLDAVSGYGAVARRAGPPGRRHRPGHDAGHERDRVVAAAREAGRGVARSTTPPGRSAPPSASPSWAACSPAATAAARRPPRRAPRRRGRPGPRGARPRPRQAADGLGARGDALADAARDAFTSGMRLSMIVGAGLLLGGGRLRGSAAPTASRRPRGRHRRPRRRARARPGLTHPPIPFWRANISETPGRHRGGEYTGTVI